MNWYKKHLNILAQDKGSQGTFPFFDEDGNVQKINEPIDNSSDMPILSRTSNDGTVVFNIKGTEYTYRASRYDFVDTIKKINLKSPWKALKWAEQQARVAWAVDPEGKYRPVDLRR